TPLHHSLLSLPDALPIFWFQSMALAPDATFIAIASTAENTLLMSTWDGTVIADIPGGEYITGLGFDQTSQRLSSLSTGQGGGYRSEEHTSELQSLTNIVC